MLSALWSDLKYRWRALIRRGAVEGELDDEIGFHLERETEKYQRQGFSPAEARRRARLAFGGVDRIKEESRDARGLSALEIVTRDLAYAARMLRGSPGFTLAVVGTLALGLGANAAMFGIVDRLLFRPPPFLGDPARVHRVYLVTEGRGGTNYEPNIAYTTYRDLVRTTSSFDVMAATFDARMAVGVGEDTREMRVAPVSASLFELFDAPPALGRYFGPAEDSVPEGSPVVVLSHALWQTRYGGRPDVLGTGLQIGPVVYTVVGVAPAGFVGVQEGPPPAAFIPITTYGAHVEWTPDRAAYYTKYDWGWMELLVRRKAGVSEAAAAADLSQAYQRSYAVERTGDAELPPATIAHPRAIVSPIQTERGPNQTTVGKVAQWVGGVALIVLLIACANVANLLLARALRRRREIGLRLALGVSRTRLFAQLLTESVLLATLGGAAGLLVAHWGGSLLRSLFLPDAGGTRALIDWRTVAFAGLATLAVGVLTGLAPILQARRTDVGGALRIGAREGTYQRSRTRTALLLVQGALSVLLLVGAGLFVRSLHQVRNIRLGYDVDPILYVDLNLRGLALSPDRRAQLARRLLAEAQTYPEVEHASLAVTLPFWLSRSTDLFVPGIDSVGRLGHFGLQAGSPDYFATMGTRILRGRGITAADGKNAPGVLVVNEAMADVLWPGQDPLGRCVKIEADTVPCSTVVGVAENIRNRNITAGGEYFYYLSAEQFRPQFDDLVIRVRGRAADQAETIRKRLQTLMPGTSYVTATPFRDMVDPNLRSWELGATMFLAFGLLALVLAGVGLYSVIAYNVAQRTQELGLRIALGASLADLLRLVLGEGIRFALLGLGIGGLLALWGSRWLGPLLYAESPRDPLVFGVVAAVLLMVAAVASAVPAWRAATVDPNVALRTD